MGSCAQRNATEEKRETYLKEASLALVLEFTSRVLAEARVAVVRFDARSSVNQVDSISFMLLFGDVISYSLRYLSLLIFLFYSKG